MAPKSLAEQFADLDDPTPKGLLRSPIPSILRPARGVVSKQNAQILGTNARHDSISTESPPAMTNVNNPAMAHFPSVLRPAGRQIGTIGNVALPFRPAKPEGQPGADSLQGQRDIIEGLHVRINDANTTCALRFGNTC